ncbi:MAG: dephospho-CoA kinase, partial [Bacteroidales bacterium]|nr:dephospho-CoA kinase [Bacteroidales bacterium]
MLKIGLTGNIGSGKSVVSKIFELFGIYVYNADREAKKYLQDNSVKSKIKQIISKNIFDIYDEIDRQKLADIVFKNKEALIKLNSIIHPLVRNDFNNWLDKHSNEAYIIYEAAILFESGFYKDFDAVITVSAPEDLMIKRVMKRDGVLKEHVIQRMKNQMN